MQTSQRKRISWAEGPHTGMCTAQEPQIFKCLNADPDLEGTRRRAAADKKNVTCQWVSQKTVIPFSPMAFEGNIL